MKNANNLQVISFTTCTVILAFSRTKIDACSLRFVLRSAVYLLVLTDSVAIQAEERRSTDAGPVEAVLSGWLKRESEYSTVTLKWRNLPTSETLSKLNAAVTSSIPEFQNTHEMDISLGDFAFKSWQLPPLQIERGRDFNIAREVFDEMPERSLSPYAYLLKSHFGIPVPKVSFQRIVREFVSGELNDSWLGDEHNYSRATLQKVPEYGADDWALLQLDTDDNLKCASLDSIAALMAFRPTVSQLFPFHRENCHIDSKSVYVSGTDCIRISEIDPLTNNSRVWFVSSTNPQRLCRFMGQTTTQGVLIDFHWKTVGSSPEVAGWEFCFFHKEDTPLQYWGKSEVIAMNTPTGPISPSITITDFPVGTWVIDERQDNQYLVMPDKTKRLILREELAWLPLQAELAQTQTGQVSQLICSKIWRRKIWSRVIYYFILAAFFSTCTWGVFVLRRYKLKK